MARRSSTSTAGLPTHGDMVPGGPPLIGRNSQLQALRSALSETEQRSGCLVLVAGEPGIAKTRLLEELAAMAHAGGDLIAWGRCWESPGSPYYWPWVQVIRAMMRELSEERVVEWLGPVLAPVAEILPE